MAGALYTLRPATMADSEFVYQVLRATLKEYVAQTRGWNETFQRNIHHKFFDCTHAQVIVCGGADAGYLEVVREQAHVSIREIMLLPECQGLGIGSRIIRDLLQEAAAKGMPVKLGVQKLNHRAKKLYERLGFVEESETLTHYLMEAVPGAEIEWPA